MARAQKIETLKCAIKAVEREVFGFRFDYPLQVVPDAGPRESLHYYLYSSALSWEAMRIDANGVPRAWYRITGPAYWPAYIAWYGLVNLEHHLRHHDEQSLTIFLKQIDWLEANVVLRPDGAAVWPMHFDYPMGPIVLKAPWVSAHAQGLAISALVRGWRVTRRPRLLELLHESARIFDLRVTENGIRLPTDGHILYTEVPGGPPPGILDGFVTSLLGLYDLFTETGNSNIQKLFEEGVAGLKHVLPRWDYRGRWSWYGNHAYLSPPAYHCLNRLLLITLARLSGEQCFADYAASWDPKRLSRHERAHIYFAFLLTKNRCRLKQRTWRQGLQQSVNPKGQPVKLGPLIAENED